MKWTKILFFKRPNNHHQQPKLKKDTTSCNKVWKVVLNLACYTCSPERKLSKGKPTKFWYLKFTLIWRDWPEGWTGGENHGHRSHCRHRCRSGWGKRINERISGFTTTIRNCGPLTFQLEWIYCHQVAPDFSEDEVGFGPQRLPIQTGGSFH